MRHLDEMPNSGLPRLADFTRFAMAAMPAFGWEPGEFLADMLSNQSNSANIAAEASPMLSRFLRFVRWHRGSRWETNATELFSDFKKWCMEKPEGWPSAYPKAPNSFSQQLRELQSLLLQVGVHIEFHKSGNRMIQITDRRQPVLGRLDSSTS
jgi:hypothetical protein